MGKIQIRAGMMVLAMSAVAFGCSSTGAKNPADKNAETEKAKTGDEKKAQASEQNQDGGSGKNKEFTLANGLKILVRPDHRAPIVVSQIWYKAGSSYEKNGT
ncbi:MAG: hypothetical protein ACC707_16515, partial [Thiohalomonadales bacterium]